MNDPTASCRISLLANRRRSLISLLSHLKGQNENFERKCFKEIPWEVLHDGNTYESRKSDERHLCSIYNRFRRQINPVDPSWWAHLHQVGEVAGGRGYQEISCSRANLLKEDTCYADLRFPCPRPIITAAKCFDELKIFSGLVGEPFDAFQVRVPALFVASL